MRMLSVRHAVPDPVVTNDDIVKMIRDQNADRFGDRELDTL